MATTTTSITLRTPGGYRRAFPFPANFEVCWRCRGTGSHVHPAIDGHGLSSEDFDADPDFEEAYFAGAYDVTCDECGGERVVAVVDEDGLKGIKAARWRLYLRQQDEARAYARECEAERRMGA